MRNVSWAQRISERYPNSSVREWLNFCKRTGHGDVEAARTLVRQFGVDPDAAPAGAQGPKSPADLQNGLAAWLDGSTRKALDSLHKAYDTANPVAAGCALMALADEQGDTAQRDAILADLCAKHRDQAPALMAVLELFRDGFARGGDAVPDPKALEKAVENVKPNLRGNTLFYVGWLLRKHGKPEDAATYLKRCVESQATNTWLKRIAQNALQRMNAAAAPAQERPAAAP